MTNEHLTTIAEALAVLERARARTQAEIERIEAEGMVQAKEHWRSGKYLYLIYPQVNGERKREYVGANPEKIEAARRRVANYERHQTLTNHLNTLARSIRRIEGQLADLAAFARSTAKYLGADNGNTKSD